MKVYFKVDLPRELNAGLIGGTEFITVDVAHMDEDKENSVTQGFIDDLSGFLKSWFDADKVTSSMEEIA